MSPKEDRLLSGQKRRLGGKRSNMVSPRVNHNGPGRRVQHSPAQVHQEPVSLEAAVRDCSHGAQFLMRDVGEQSTLKGAQKDEHRTRLGPEFQTDTVTSSEDEGASQQTWSQARHHGWVAATTDSQWRGEWVGWSLSKEQVLA